MNAEKHEFGGLSISDRKAVLSLDSDSLPLNASQNENEIDLFELDDWDFDLIVNQILGYQELDEIETVRKETLLPSALGDAKWSEGSSYDGYSSSYRDIKAIIKSSGLKNLMD